MRREKEEGARVADEESAFVAAMRNSAGDDARAAWMDEPVQQRRDDVEWGRWMETDKANWWGSWRRLNSFDPRIEIMRLVSNS